MPRFRSLLPPIRSAICWRESIQMLLAEMFRPAHFYLGAQLSLRWEHVAEQELVWEIFQGRLLDPVHTRCRRSFAAWTIHATHPAAQDQPNEPLLALYLDDESRQLHLVRGLDSYVWEGYDAGGNVYLSRERRKWVRERVATLALDRFTEEEELRDELACASFKRLWAPAGCLSPLSKHRCRFSHLGSSSTAIAPMPRKPPDPCVAGAVC